MEQRNYSDHNDIRPIEDLFGGAKQPPPEPYGARKRFFNEFQEQKPEPQQQPKQQPLRAQPVVGNNVGGNKFEAPKKREDFTLEPSIRKEPRKKASGISGASHRSPALWGLLGFAIGVAFWHFVGFWSFMEDAVLRTPPQQTELSNEVLQRQNIALNSRNNGTSRNTAMRNTLPVVNENINACVTLVMDRATKKTFAVHCKSGVRFFYRNRPLRTAARITN
ncbi:MAG: hypothetical protein ACRBBN_18435 [Methyloligellaceae bacterium]